MLPQITYSKEEIQKLTRWFFEGKSISGHEQLQLTYGFRNVPLFAGFAHLNSENYPFDQEQCLFGQFSVTEFMEIYQAAEGVHLSSPQILSLAKKRFSQHSSFEDIKAVFLLCTWSLTATNYPFSNWEKDADELTDGPPERSLLVEPALKLQDQAVQAAASSYPSALKSYLKETFSLSFFGDLQDIHGYSHDAIDLSAQKDLFLAFVKPARDWSPRPDFMQSLRSAYFERFNSASGDGVMVFAVEDIPFEEIRLHPGSYVFLKASEATNTEFLQTVDSLTLLNYEQLYDADMEGASANESYSRDWVMNSYSQAFTSALQSSRALA